MAIVVTSNCNGCRFTECVMVCPVSCFHGDAEMVYIDRDACIECRACVPVCPVHAIFDSEDLPSELASWDEINRARALELPVVLMKQPPLPTSEAKRAELGF